ncbi:MAG: hypothetical protein ACFCVF_05690 [Kineosporiaceae bacterium]
MIPAPRSPSGDEPVPTDPAEASLADPATMSLPDLRRQRRLLADELRGVRYWRRIARAQTDLLVAGLVHHSREDLAGLHADGGPPTPPVGDRLVRLRERDHLMAAYEHTLRHDLDTVTHELAARVADPDIVTSPAHSP